MSDDTQTGQLELGASMDYPEHQRTFGLFVALTKYISLGSAALLIAMAFGFFTSAGFISATILFILICVVGAYLLR